MVGRRVPSPPRWLPPPTGRWARLGQRNFSTACEPPPPAHAAPVPLTSRLEQLRDDLAVVDDPQERLMLLVDRSKRSPALPAAERIEANRVHACVSVVWLVPEMRGDVCVFRGDAESPVVRALVILLCEFFSGMAPAVIAASDHDPLETLDVTRNLSPTRRNGLAATRKTILEFAQHQLAPRAAQS